MNCVFVGGGGGGGLKRDSDKPRPSWVHEAGESGAPGRSARKETRTPRRNPALLWQGAGGWQLGSRGPGSVDRRRSGRLGNLAPSAGSLQTRTLSAPTPINLNAAGWSRTTPASPRPWLLTRYSGRREACLVRLGHGASGFSTVRFWVYPERA